MAASAAAAYRDRRMQVMLQHFPDFESYRILDLGGTRLFWQQSPARPAHVTIVNLDQGNSVGTEVSCIEADACEFRPQAGERYDMVFSNSLIEHVGGYSRRQQIAQVVRKLSPNSWIQTPYRYFPIEPHWVMPGQQFMPLALRARLSARWGFGHVRASNYQEALEECLSTELLTQTELSYLFPDASIWKERWHGITKSIVAVRRAGIH